MIKTANPTLTLDTFKNLSIQSEKKMTLEGTVNKTLIMLGILTLTASYVWSSTMQGSSPKLWMIIGGIGGFIFALITAFKKEKSAVTAPIYAGFQGLFLGGLSATFEMMYPGIVIQSVGLTFGTLFALLVAYRSRLIHASENFKLGVVAATGGLMIVYLIGFLLSFFGIQLPVFGNGIVGILFSLVVVIIASLNLVLDFDFIESGVENGAPDYMEWYGAFGLMVTLIWLYIEMLRLLAKLRSQD